MAKPITDKDLHAAIDRAHDLWLSQYDGDLPEHTFSADFEAKAAAIPQKKAHRRHPLRTTIAVAVIVAALTMTIGADMVADPIFFSRGAISGISQVLPKSTDWHYSSDYDHEGETRRPVFHWIPEGWTECDKSLIRNTTHIEFTHESVEKSSLIIRIHRVTPTSGHTTSFNTENAEVSTIEINGNEALLVVGDDYVLLKWFIENYSCSISMSHIVAVEDVIKFAENMELK